jgi:hypothetical protein
VPVVEPSVNVKLVPAVRPDSPKKLHVGVVQVGEPDNPLASVIGRTKILLAAVTAVVLIVYVVVVVGTTTLPLGAEPQAAGDALLTLQLLIVPNESPCTPAPTVFVKKATVVAPASTPVVVPMKYIPALFTEDPKAAAELLPGGAPITLLLTT